MAPSPKILLIDIETSPIVGYTWGMYETDVLSVVEPVKVICCAYKWLGEKSVTVKALCDYSGYRGGVVDDKKLIRDLWKVLEEADVVIAHNGDSFDMKILNTRFLAHGLTAPSTFKTIDTKKVAKKYFRFGNNSLNELGKYLKQGQKAETGGFDTWLDCMNGCKPAWDRMKRYNIQDIKLLERVYLQLRPFIGNHPNLNLFGGKAISEKACTNCTSTNTTRRGFSITKAGRHQRYQCNDCGSWSTGTYERAKRIA